MACSFAFLWQLGAVGTRTKTKTLIPLAVCWPKRWPCYFRAAGDMLSVHGAEEAEAAVARSRYDCLFLCPETSTEDSEDHQGEDDAFPQR